MPDAITTPYEAGLELIAAGRYFEAHEALEEAWRASDAAERDFFQGLVHVSVAWYQAGRAIAWAASGSWRRPDGGSARMRPGIATSTSPTSCDRSSLAGGRYPDLPAVISRARGSRARG